jgi:ABC-2 type transport system ATP-binding protein
MDTPAETVIEVKKVSKVFNLPHERHSSLKSLVINFYKRKRSVERQVALDNVSFEVKKGEFLAIIGRNGGGKSTLLKLLAGIYSPNQGEVMVSGKLTPFIELGVGFNQELSGRENVFLNGALLGFNRKEISAMYDDIVAFAELERFMDQKLKNYSSGMQVRLAFSIAIRAKSDILLLDEVLAVGDAAFQQKCYNYFEELKREKRTVVFVSHDMSAVRRFCTRAVYIDRGKLVKQGDVNEVADHYTADNLAVAEQAASQAQDQAPSSPFKISSKIVERSPKKLVVKLSYESKTSDELYAGLALMKDGFSIAEICTPPNMALRGKGEVSYTFDIGMLNAGVYLIDAALFKRENRELVGFTKDKAKFVIKGADPTKGAALKLADNWKRGS